MTIPPSHPTHSHVTVQTVVNSKTAADKLASLKKHLIVASPGDEPGIHEPGLSEPRPSQTNDACNSDVNLPAGITLEAFSHKANIDNNLPVSADTTDAPTACLSGGNSCQGYG